MMLQKYYPPGLLGLGLTALFASFMSGMAGNVTAFNTVWTYDIYKPYIKSDGSDAHYMKVGRQATVFGTILSVATAYVAMNFGNINDLLQLVFSFINAPLFATFLLGMFWARCTRQRRVLGAAQRHPRLRRALPADRRRHRGPPARCTPTRATWRATSGAPSSRGSSASS